MLQLKFEKIDRGLKLVLVLFAFIVGGVAIAGLWHWYELAQNLSSRKPQVRLFTSLFVAPVFFAELVIGFVLANRVTWGEKLWPAVVVLAIGSTFLVSHLADQLLTNKGYTFCEGLSSHGIKDSLEVYVRDRSYCVDPAPQ